MRQDKVRQSNIDRARRDFARRLVVAREAAGHKDAKSFADVLGIESPTYRKYERGESSPEYDILQQICLLLGTSADSLIFGTNTTAQTKHVGKPDDAVDVRFGLGQLIVDLRDGRTIATPIQWYPSLRNATDIQRANWQISGDGGGIHWPDVDEDLSVEAMLDGRPAVGWDR